jgi:hypothetical protein
MIAHAYRCQGGGLWKPPPGLQRKLEIPPKPADFGHPCPQTAPGGDRAIRGAKKLSYGFYCFHSSFYSVGLPGIISLLLVYTNYLLPAETFPPGDHGTDKIIWIFP